MNHLANQSSPYLLQHAHNPVDWYPWGEEALDRAKREDKPILVSIGYSTCHWCHVMERESFEDEATAAVMNEHFVCIKVDREERPDVDRIYMDACQAISGGGGWPLNAFLLPDLRPFYAGTYYPPVRKYNRPSWTEVLNHLSGAYRDNRAELEEQATRLVKSIAEGSDRLLNLELKTEDDTAWREALVDGLRGQYDPQNGGFGGAPKFPGTMGLEVLLANGVLHEEFNDLHLAAHAALAMLDGGIYDQLGGGFSRYTVDAAWRVPHFEKMLYDNALLLRLLAKLQMRLPNQRFLDGIGETTDWLLREMQLPNGGYRAALDADSEGVEGKYYVWELAEVRELLDPQDAELVAAFYGLTEAGNWEEEHTNIPYRPMTLTAAAAAVGLDPEVARTRLAAARERLHEHRRLRIPPGADGKLILEWNALLISGWTWCYRATGEAHYLNLAEAAWEVLATQLFVDQQWYRNLTAGRLGAPAFLDDYAALATAALDLSEVTFDLGYADTARNLVDHVLHHFSDPDDTFCFLRPPAASELPVTSKDLFDNALPSGNSQLADCLFRLARLTGEEAYRERGQRMLTALRGGLERYPTSFGNWARIALVNLDDQRELVVTGPGARAAARPFLSAYRPGLLIVATESDREDVPLLAGRYGEEIRYFVCQNQSCQLPVNTERAAEALL